MSKGFIMGGAGGENVSAEVNAQESLIEQIQAALEGKAASKIFAVIGVTYPEGSTCTCTDGIKEFAAKDISGQCIFVIPYAGSWTVTATDGTDTSSKTVEITTEGQNVSVELSYVLRLYDSGNEFTDITGGWGTDGYSASAGIYAATKNADNFYFPGVNNAYSFLGTQNAVDLSGKKTLFIDWQGTSAYNNTSHNVSVYQTKNIDISLVYVGYGLAGERRVDSLDISAINGEAFIGITAGWNTNCQGYVYRIWAE